MAGSRIPTGAYMLGQAVSDGAGGQAWTPSFIRVDASGVNVPAGTSSDPAQSQDALFTSKDFLTKTGNATGGGGNVTFLPTIAGKVIRIHALRFTVSAAGLYTLIAADSAGANGVLIERFRLYGAGASVSLDFRPRPYHISGTGGVFQFGFDGANSIDYTVDYVVA